MAIFGASSSSKALLAAKWRTYHECIEEHDTRIRAREAQLRVMLLSEDAFNRAGLEVFCEERLFLPVDGLEGIGEYLLEQGFYWEWHDRQTARVLFPDSWKLIPSELRYDDRDSFYTATLVDPSGESVATISYCVYPYLASIRGL